MVHLVGGWVRRKTSLIRKKTNKFGILWVWVNCIPKTQEKLLTEAERFFCVPYKTFVLPLFSAGKTISIIINIKNCFKTDIDWYAHIVA